MDKRVTIQTRLETDDDGGGQTIAYTDWLTVWAAIAPGAGREFVSAQQLTPELSHVIKVRYRPGITPKHRLKYAAAGVTRFFPIYVIADPDERHEQLLLYCSEVQQS